MKILIITGIFPPDIGGPATYVPRIATELAKSGHAIEVITLSGELYHDDRGFPFKVIRIKRGKFKPIRILETFLKVVLYGLKSDILFVNGLEIIAVLANLFIRKFLVTRVVGDWAWEKGRNKGVVKDTVDDFQKIKYPLKVEFYRMLQKFFFNRADAIITPSLYFKGIITNYGIPENKIEVIYNPLEELPIDLPSREVLKKELQLLGQVVVTVGRLVNWKGIDGIIRVISKMEGVHLIIVGDGPERKGLEALKTELKIQDRIRFVGNLDQKDVLKYLRAADVFVLNSLFESFSFAVAEAMLVGVPVVATRVCSIPEIVEDGVTGLLVEAGNDSQLKTALHRLLSDDVLREQLVGNARRQLDKFSLRTRLEKILNVFEKVTKDSSSDLPSVLSVGGTRYSYPLGDMHKKKFSYLSKVARNYVFAYSIDNGFRAFFDSANFYLIPSRITKIIRYPFFLFSALVVIFYIVYKKDIKVIVCQSPYEGISAVIAKFLLKILGKRVSVIIELHGDWEEAPFLYDEPRFGIALKIHRLFGRIISRFVLKNANLVRTVSEFINKKVSKKIQKLTITFPTYTNIELFSEYNGSNKESLDYQNRFVLYAGMLVYLKGVHVLIKSFELVVKRHKELKLLIAGEGKYKEELQKLIRDYRLEDNVIFLGHLQQGMLRYYMEGCAVLVLPSFSEGLPRVILEAMACGKPVIGTEMGGIPELIKDGENGFLVPPNDAEVLAERVSYLIGNPEIAKQMGEKGKSFILNRFSSESYVSNFKKMIQMAIENVS